MAPNWLERLVGGKKGEVTPRPEAKAPPRQSPSERTEIKQAERGSEAWCTEVSQTILAHYIQQFTEKKGPPTNQWRKLQEALAFGEMPEQILANPWQHYMLHFIRDLGGENLTPQPKTIAEETGVPLADVEELFRVTREIISQRYKK